VDVADALSSVVMLQQQSQVMQRNNTDSYTQTTLFQDVEINQCRTAATLAGRAAVGLDKRRQKKQKCTDLHVIL